MNRIRSLVTLICFIPLLTVSQDQRPMTFMDIMEVKRATAGTISPDGAWFLYTYAVPDWKKEKDFTDVWLVNAAEGHASAKQMTYTTDKNETNVQWALDSRTFFFLSDREAASGASTRQLYRMRIDGGEAQRVTNDKEGVDSYALSKDGRWLAYLAGKDEKKHVWVLPADSLTSAKPREATKRKVPVRWWSFAENSRSLYYSSPDSFETLAAKGKKEKFTADIRNELTAPNHLWSVDMSSFEDRRLTEGTAYSVEGVSLSPDPEWLAFRGIRNERFSRTITERNNHGDLYLVNIPSGDIERITENEEISEGMPSFSPNGDIIAFSASNDFTYFRDQKLYLREVDEEGEPFRKLGGDVDHDVRTGFWSDDGRTIYFNEGIGATNQLFAIDVQTGVVSQVSDVRGRISVSYDQNFHHVLISYSSPTEPDNYYTTKDLSSIADRTSWTRLTNSNPQFSGIALGETEVVRWTSTDGKTVEGVLVKPLAYEKGKRYPLVVQIHGGPAGASILNFNVSYGYYPHVFAAAGYVCLQPNYRGSSNYGETFRTQIVKDYFRQGYEDIMAGVDHLIAQGIVDPERMGAMGWSAGGHWSNWILTHTDRFKAISSGAGTMNWISMYAQSDVQRARAEYFGGLPYDNTDHYWDVSPLKHIKNAKTPTMIHVVEGDPRVPSPQSQELHMALRQLGVPTEFIVYPGKTHGITQPRNRLFKMVSEFRWMDKWLNGRESWLDWNQLLETIHDTDEGAEKR